VALQMEQVAKGRPLRLMRINGRSNYVVSRKVISGKCEALP
jgi:hypothetical protein